MSHAAAFARSANEFLHCTCNDLTRTDMRASMPSSCLHVLLSSATSLYSVCCLAFYAKAPAGLEGCGEGTGSSGGCASLSAEAAATFCLQWPVRSSGLQLSAHLQIWNRTVALLHAPAAPWIPNSHRSSMRALTALRDEWSQALHPSRQRSGLWAKEWRVLLPGLWPVAGTLCCIDSQAGGPAQQWT